MEEKSGNLEFRINGKLWTSKKEIDPELTLLELIREEIGLTGTKLGCGEGGCGACTVEVDGETMNSCLLPVNAVHGKSVVTVEGIGDAKNPHIAQKTLAEGHGSQCGFCTPGFVMSLYNAYNKKKHCASACSGASANTEEKEVDIENCFDGNLCRCTGYRPIIEAADKLLYAENNENGKLNGLHNVDNLGQGTETNVIFGDGKKWYIPKTTAELLELKSLYPQAKLIAGNTEVGVENRFKHTSNPIQIFIKDVKELSYVKIEDDTLLVGGAATLSTLQKVLKAANLQNYQTQTSKAIVSMLTYFASNQIRNAATLSGNIATASPISDMNPTLLGLGASLVLSKLKNNKKISRTLPLDNFFISYRRTELQEDEVIEQIRVPLNRSDESVAVFKQSRRKEDDIAIVNACFKIGLNATGEIKNARLAYGGVSVKSVLATRTQEFLVGKIWCQETVDAASKIILEEINLPDNVPGGMPKYRMSLCVSFLQKFFAQTVEAHDICGTTYMDKSHPKMKSTQVFVNEKAGMQDSKHVATLEDIRAPVGEPISHRAALLQCTGEAKYVDDEFTTSSCLHGALVLSTESHARILLESLNSAVDSVQKNLGFDSFFSAKDISEDQNIFGPVRMDEMVFREETVTSIGQVIGIVLADTHRKAKECAYNIQRLIKYEKLEPVVISIQDAREQGSFYPFNSEIITGNVSEGFTKADKIVSGSVRMAGQEHFYLETQGTMVTPGENGELIVVSSTQNPEKTQKFCAKACGVPRNKVVSKVKRMGGGFGGKETRNIYVAAAAAVASIKTQRQVKVILDRDDDMVSSGTRHPFVGEYKVGFTNDGMITAVEVDLFSNAGYSHDLSESVMERALFHIENSYKVPNLSVRGRLCKTNTPTNTAYRGFGGPQGMLVCETYMQHIANELNVTVEKIRELNMYKQGQKTHYGQTLVESPLRRLYSEVMDSAQIVKRQEDIKLFNSQNKTLKRGLTVIPTKFGISFTAKFMNQAGALVNVYTDGTVLVSHGGTEMGQGLHTKMIQVAAKEFGIPVDSVHISETSTDKVPNSSPTAASASSDMYGMAVLDACEQINERLAPLRKENPNISFVALVNKAYFSRIDLSAHGFYKTPYLGYQFDLAKTNPEIEQQAFNYYTFGAAASEVEIDCLTGDFRVLRTDIVMDLGKSLNPAIDIGQIEGGFIQGLGWCMIEEPVWGHREENKSFDWLPEGACFTKGPGAYKIPASGDVPEEFNVRLLDNSPNPKAVHSSRAVGEPPFFLGSSVFFAAKEAIKAYRKQNNRSEWFEADCPLSSERIRMACLDSITDQVNADDKYKPGLFV
eukprot:snap_masked-scaffold_4-processed-gene-11.29-mRNA-1 protein AED:0.00 eAED:0.00 QI:0/-1/0/1/-1/1/1/0/1317